MALWLDGLNAPTLEEPMTIARRVPSRALSLRLYRGGELVNERYVLGVCCQRLIDLDQSSNSKVLCESPL